MNVIANTSSIRCWIILAKDRDAFALSQGDLQHDWNEVALGIMIFTDRAVCGSARSVEVTKGGNSEAISMCIVGQCAFHHEFRKAVRVDWVLRRVLGDRHFVRLTVGGGRARKNKSPNPGRPHGFEQFKSCRHVVLIVHGWMLHRFADQRIGRKVHDRFDLFLLHDPHQQRTICQIALNENLFRDTFPMASGKIVVDPNRVPERPQQLD